MLRSRLILIALLILFTCTIHALDQPSTQDSIITIKAKVLEILGDQNQFHAKGNVIVNQKNVEIRGDRAIYNKTTQLVIITQNVTLRQGDLKMECNKVTGYGQEDRIVAEGKIRIFFKDVRGQSEKATYAIKKNFIELKGDPMMIQGNNKITGKIMILDFTSGKIKTMGDANIQFDLEK